MRRKPEGLSMVVHLPVIPATWEAETRRITFQGHPREYISTNKSDVVVYACNPSYKVGMVQGDPRQKCKTLSKKKKNLGNWLNW
jgi:hypothetical protein